MKKTLAVLASILVVVCLAGCATLGLTQITADQINAAMCLGTWTGTYSSVTYSDSGKATANGTTDTYTCTDALTASALAAVLQTYAKADGTEVYVNSTTQPTKVVIIEETYDSDTGKLTYKCTTTYTKSK